MTELRAASIPDLAVVASWISSAEICHQWAGTRVGFPIRLERLPEEIEFRVAESWCLTQSEKPVAFGQIVPKADSRQHLARLVVEPVLRGRGLGRALTERLLKLAMMKSPTRVSLNVCAGNVAAEKLYRSVGFVVFDRPPSESESASHYMEHAT